MKPVEKKMSSGRWIKPYWHRHPFQLRLVALSVFLLAPIWLLIDLAYFGVSDYRVRWSRECGRLFVTAWRCLRYGNRANID